MSVSYFVIYQGESADQERLIEHYRTVHVPILLRFPGIMGVVVHQPLVSRDPQGVNKGAFALIVQLEFSDAEALETALNSDARAAAREDMIENFPDFDGTVLHQATLTQRLTP